MARDPDDIKHARPKDDVLAMARSAERVGRALFGHAEPARLGRFVLLKPVAGGNMGEVHRAYDPQLERHVALKVIKRGSETARSRAFLVTEARVLAQLSHPNVVAVHEVAEVDDQVVIVMELVEGETVADWCRAPRPWRAVVDVYLQAGRGLAAAHELGIVHRDFKPANVIIGNDGRVRVLDFGLARFAPSETSAPRVVEGPNVVESEIAGTIAYMSPEQLAGRRVTPSSDQFSFCVALHRALYRVAPFAGTTADAIAASIARGYAPPAAPRLPGWLRAILVRGLAAEPGRRFPSLAALLDVLGSDRSRRQRMIVLGLAGVAVTTSIAIAVTRSPASLPACDGDATSRARVWNAERARAISKVLARVATPYAKSIGGKLVTLLDDYSARWGAVHLDTCQRQRRDPRNAGLAARVVRIQECLDQRLQDLSNAVEVISAVDAETVVRSIDVVARLPVVESCARLDIASEQPAPPPSGEVAEEVLAIRARLSRAAALERAGKVLDAISIADASLSDAIASNYQPVVLEAALAKGTFLAASYDFARAIEPLATAERIAHEHRQYHAAVVASARRIYAEGMEGRAIDQLVGRAQAVELLGRGLSPGHTARPLLANYLGVLHMVRGDRAAARVQFEAARTLLAEIERPDLELVGIEMNLAMLTESREDRERLAGSAYRRFEEQLGAHHLTTLTERCRYAHYVADPVRAYELARSANAGYRSFHPTQVRDRVYCVHYEATLADDLGHDSSERYAELASLSATHADLRWRSAIAEGRLARQRGDRTASAKHFRSVIAGLESSAHWWDRQYAAEGHIGAGQVAEDNRDLASASDHFEQALAALEPISLRNEDLEVQLRLAFVRAALARTLRARGGAADRVRALEVAARSFYETANPSMYRGRIESLTR